MLNYTKPLNLMIGVVIGLLIGLNLSHRAATTTEYILVPGGAKDADIPHPQARPPIESLHEGGSRVPVVSEEELRHKMESKVASDIIGVLGPSWGTEESPMGEGEGPMFGGLRHGEWAIYWPTREWTEVGEYVLGARHGTWLIHDKDGVLLRETTYVAGKKNGPCRDRSSATDPWRSYRYVNDKLVD